MARQKRTYGFKQMTAMKPSYNTQQWEDREKEYIEAINSIIIPYEPDDVDITAINAAIDQIYTIAKIEQAIYSRQYDKQYQIRKNSETEVYMIIKNNPPLDANGNPLKMTEAEMKARGVQFLNTNPAPNQNTKYNVFQLESMAADRKTFMDSVVDILKSKSEKMITASGALKLALQINQNNVPQNAGN